MGKHGPCNHCGVTSTPLWRNGPPEKPVLCNACGSRWRTKGTLSNYTPLHSRAEVSDEFDDHGFSNVKTMSIKKKEAKRKLNHRENLNIGKFVIKLNRVHLPIPTKSQDEGDSGSAISSTDLTCPTQWETNNNTRKRTCFSRPKSSSIEKLTKDLYTILNEQRQSSHLFGSFEEDLIFENDSLPIGYGSVLIRHPSSVKEEESETSSLSIENNAKKGSKEGMLMKEEVVVENGRESCCFSPRIMFNSSSPVDNLLMFDSSSQFVHDQNSDYGLLLDLPSNNSFPEAELLI